MGITINTLTPEYEAHVRRILGSLADDFLVPYLENVVSKEEYINDIAMEMAARLYAWEQSRCCDTWERLWEYVNPGEVVPREPRQKVPVSKVATVNNNSVSVSVKKEKGINMSMSKVLAWALENGYEASDVFSRPDEVKQAYADAHSTSTGKKKPAKVYNTVLLLKDGSTLVLPPMEAKRGKGAKDTLFLAVSALLLANDVELSDVESVVRSPAQSIEEFFSSDDE